MHTPEKRSRVVAELMLVLTTVLWGSTFATIKAGLGGASPLLFLSVRFAAAFAVGLFLWFRRLRGISRTTLLHGLALGAFMFGGYGSQTFGLSLTTVAKSSLFTYTFALLTPALQLFFLRKPLTAGNFAGLAVVVAGMIVFTHPGSASLNTGDWVTLGGAGLFAFYVVLLDKYSSADDPTALVEVQFGTTAILALCASLVLEPHRRLTLDVPTVVALSYLALVGSVVAVSVMNHYQRRTTPTKAVLIYALEPIFAIAFGYMVLRETVSGEQVLGGGAIVLGVLISELWPIRRRKRAAS